MNYKPLNNGLKSIYQEYDTFIIDLWGVIHNGIALNKAAIEVLEELDSSKKEYYLISNAPRPKASVGKFLKKLHLNEKFFNHIYTSGDAALGALKYKKFGKNFFHIGPERDFDLFSNFEEDNVKKIELADYFLCTGLFEEYEDDLDFYKFFFSKHTHKKLICTNPDLIVHRGEKEEYCAGSIAKIFKDMGGEVIYYGKPYPAIYNDCIKDKKRVLAIGDNLNTDIKGANVMKFDSLFILNGVHRDYFSRDDVSNLDSLLKKLNLKINYYQFQLKW